MPLGSGGAVKGRFWIGKWIIDLGALPALGRVLGGQGGGGVDLVLRALGGVWGACGAWWGLVGAWWGLMGGC